MFIINLSSLVVGCRWSQGLAAVFLALVFAVPEGRTEQLVDLYQTETLVTSQSSRERARAATDGLAEVVLRISGTLAALQAPAVIDGMRRAQSYVYEFQYASTDQTLTVDDREVPASRLILRFSRQGVERLLRRANLPMWPANRPSLLVWLVVDDLDRGRHLVGPADDPAAIAALNAAAGRRGLPLLAPLLDLEDRVALAGDAAWVLAEDKIRLASGRYQSDAILVGRYSSTSRGEWRATWLLLHKGQSRVFDSVGFELDTVIAAGVNQVADHLAGIYAIVPGQHDPDAVVMQLTGVADFTHYVRVLDYLEKLAVVRQAHLAAVRGDTLLLHLYTDGDLALLLNALALDRRLVPVASVDPGLPGPEAPEWQLGPRGSIHNPLHYQWSGPGG